MQYEKYAPLLVSSDSLEFSFVSEGPKGEIKIVVQFNATENPAIYNLAFGNLLEDGSVDDTIKNDNKDRNKVLATVAATVYEFTSKYPEKFIFFTGSTPERTRLYRMALTNNLDELGLDFEILGVVLHPENYSVEKLIKGKDYFGFMVKRKI
jgi:hypothetical protein